MHRSMLILVLRLSAPRATPAVAAPGGITLVPLPSGSAGKTRGLDAAGVRLHCGWGECDDTARHPHACRTGGPRLAQWPRLRSRLSLRLPPMRPLPSTPCCSTAGPRGTATTYDRGENLSTGASWQSPELPRLRSGREAYGKPVRASAAGDARLTAAAEVTIDHGGGWTTVYQHMYNVNVTSRSSPTSQRR